MGALPIVLFLLGVVFLILGWRWQSPPNEEAMIALKGLAYLKREIIRVQDQVYRLEEKIQTTHQNGIISSGRKEVEINEVEVEARKIEVVKIEHKDSNLYSLKTNEQSQIISGGGVEPKRNISPIYQEVLELAAKGHHISEIAQQLLLSQDAVMMVLQMHSKGAAR